MACRAETAAPAITDPRGHTEALAVGRVTKVLNAVGQRKRARAADEQADRNAGWIANRSQRTEALALAAAGRHQDAIAVAGQSFSPTNKRRLDFGEDRGGSGRSRAAGERCSNRTLRS
jgi:hypothetical protein